LICGEGQKADGEERKRGRNEAREAADFVWLYYRSHFLSPSPTQQYKEIGAKKLKKREREKHQPLTHQRHPVLHQGKGRPVPLTATRERRDERSERVFAFGARESGRALSQVNGGFFLRPVRPTLALPSFYNPPLPLCS
jgi:hypothetical protein